MNESLIRSYLNAIYLHYSAFTWITVPQLVLNDKLVENELIENNVKDVVRI